MRSYGKIETGFWQNPKVRQLKERPRLLLLYLFSCPHGNSVGCFVLPDGYMQADLGWSSETVSEHVSELVSKGFIERDFASGLTRIRGWWGHNTIENDNVAKSAIKTFRSLPKCEVLMHAINDLKELDNKFINKFANELWNMFDNEFRNPNLTEPNLTEPEPEPEPNLTEPSSRVRASVIDLGFDEWYAVYPKHRARGHAEKAFAKARKIASLEILIAAAKRYSETVDRREDGRFIKAPATWLNGRCWLDEPCDAKAAELPLVENGIDLRQQLRIKGFYEKGIWMPEWGDRPPPKEDVSRGTIQSSAV